MPIPELERRRVERALENFCERVPVHIRRELMFEYRFRGDAVTLQSAVPIFRIERGTPST